MEQPHRVSHLRELAVVFGILGLIGFGGPAAHVALMRRAVVDRRQWISEQRFTDLLGITSLLPGPNSTELAMHIGLDRAGRLGLLVAGLAFIVPAALIVLAIAVIYVAVGASPAGSAVLYLLKPVIIVIVAVAIARIGRTALAGPLRLVVGAAVLVLALLGEHELLLLAGGAVVLVIARNGRSGLGRLARGVVAVPAMAGTAGAAAIGLPVLFVTFLKIGAVLYGSGYVLVAFLRADFVERLGWITDRQLLDAVAIGQVTPGPLFTTATFVGYLVAGLPGAALATLAIFLPAFAFVALAGGLAAQLRRRPLTAALLDGVNAAAVGLMAAVTLQLARDAVVDLTTAALALGTALVLAGRARQTDRGPAESFASRS